jgi:hypothetical protein
MLILNVLKFCILRQAAHSAVHMALKPHISDYSGGKLSSHRVSTVAPLAVHTMKEENTNQTGTSQQTRICSKGGL